MGEIFSLGSPQDGCWNCVGLGRSAESDTGMHMKCLCFVCGDTHISRMVVIVVKEPRAALSISIQVSTRHTRPRQGDVSTRHAMHADWCMRFVSTMIMINAGVPRRFQAAWMMIESCPSGSGAMPDLFQSFSCWARAYLCMQSSHATVCIPCMHRMHAYIAGCVGAHGLQCCSQTSSEPPWSS